jgi:hypothetical protein
MWGMINMMQVITNMPILAISMPSNAQYYLSLFTNIINLKIIPTDTILDYIIGANDYVNNQISASFANVGY